MLMRVIVFGSYAKSLLNFRGPLIRDLVNRGHEVTAFAAEEDDKVKSALAEWGVSYFPVPIDRRGINPVRDLGSLQAIYRLFLQMKPDLVLSYTMKPVIYGSLVAGHLGVASASMITGLGQLFVDAASVPRRFLRFALEAMLRRSLRRNKVVFFQNRDDLTLFVDRGLVRDDQAVLVDGSGVDVDHFSFSEPKLDPPTFVMLARLIREKGVLEYIEAARKLKKIYPRAVFRLLGGFEQGSSAIPPHEIFRWANEGVIDYAGEVEDVRPLLRGATVVVLPSYYREGIPRSLLEALAVGRPIITTDMPGCRETVVNGINGYLVKPKDVDSLAQAMEKFITNPSLALLFGRKSREIAESRFDVRKVNARITEALEL